MSVLAHDLLYAGEFCTVYCKGFFQQNGMRDGFALNMFINLACNIVM